ncbi:hypothetical protein [Legionella hackeliae]|uniref:Uncharacterized protein n=1 Tax=Legionella hackeliae TaxID=449 RepID=A0A0A8UWX2_LEGHA|nr:hypothetical protein [Legionella hackeliae]KTD12620.1 hypothetical protein Lhac_1491 [Legionella hackeliae]CEK12036.1 conserved protein of unknown function [Legionella hackeliae]STX48821.1 Uncharacterised protein [Legionella hackeliae]
MSPENFDVANSLIDQARQSLQICQQITDDILNDSQSGETSFDELAQSLQLVLQYRLNCEDALVALLNLDHHLLYILGIQPGHSATVNLERMAYALGSDDLKHILHALSQLVEALLKIARRQQHDVQHHPHLDMQNKTTTPNRVIKSLKKLILKQELFMNLINKLDSSIKQLVKLEALGPVRDHIAALRGPISQFYQAIIHGLGQSQLIYQKVNKNQNIEPNLSQLLKQAEQVLNLMPSLYQPSPNYSLGHFPAKSSEELEQRASAKRLRPFFS